MNPWLSFSTRAYRWLLRLYPAHFRNEYESEMTRVFRDTCRDYYRARGAVGLATAWVETVPDLIVSVTDEHSQENFKMAKTNLIRGLAIAGMIGGALWIAASVLLLMRTNGNRLANDLGPLLMIGTSFSSLGLLGVYLKPGQSWPALSKFTLVLAVAGGFWAAFSLLVVDNWLLMLVGYFVQVGGLIMTSLILLRSIATRQWAVLFIVVAVSMFAFNTEDWRALFGAVAGIFTIVISALLLDRALNRQGEPPIAMA